MTCPVCFNLPCDYGNSVVCSCCGQLVCGNCSLGMFLHPPQFQLYETEESKLNCPICRSSYNLSKDILVENLEKVCERDGEFRRDAQICLAAEYFVDGKYRESRKLFEDLGTEIYKYRGGCYYLAVIYRHGLGGVRRSEKAFQLFLKLADVGQSLRYLGEMFLNGEGVAKNKNYGAILVKIAQKKVNFPVHYRTGLRVII